MLFAVLAVISGAGVSPSQAQDRVDIRFAPGASDTEINGTIRGDEYIDYIVNARGGQTMVVALAVTGTNGNGSAYFNILPAGQDFGGPYVGSTDDDNRAEVTVPHDGDWAIRVYLMGNDRDAGKTVGYSVNVYIAPASGGGGSAAVGGSGDVRVQFQGGTNGAELSGALSPGESRRYLLNARDGQDLYVRVAHRAGPRLDFQIFNPDGSFLLDMIPTDKEYRGQLWQSGDHIVEVINRGGATAEYNVIFGID